VHLGPGYLTPIFFWHSQFRFYKKITVFRIFNAKITNLKRYGAQKGFVETAKLLGFIYGGHCMLYYIRKASGEILLTA